MIGTAEVIEVERWVANVDVTVLVEVVGWNLVDRRERCVSLVFLPVEVVLVGIISRYALIAL